MVDEAKIKKLAAVLFDHDSILGEPKPAGATEGERRNAAAMIASLAGKDRK
jgi:hypothetical protein